MRVMMERAPREVRRAAHDVLERRDGVEDGLVEGADAGGAREMAILVEEALECLEAADVCAAPFAWKSATFGQCMEARDEGRDAWGELAGRHGWACTRHAIEQGGRH